MVNIKICGLFREEDIDFANEAGPDFAGFVFAQSRRQVSPGQAARLRSRLRDGIVPVGVFVNAPAEEIAACYRDGLIDIAQLHGDEDAAYIRCLKTLSAAGGQAPVPVIKALRIGGAEPPADDDHALYAAADYLLLDSGAGSGKPFDWNILRRPDAADTGLRQTHGRSLAATDGGPQQLTGMLYIPGRHGCRWFLAGGIDCDNIEKALSFRPFGIDVSSGAETNGVKDRKKMIELVKRVKKENL
jgi:phosphoribosylanthranilate isomerase